MLVKCTVTRIHITRWNKKMVHFRKQYICITETSKFLSIHPRELKPWSHQISYANVYCDYIHNLSKLENLKVFQLANGQRI